MYTTQMAQQAADFIREGLAESPMAGLILGSGLGMLADEVEQARVIPYDQIPHFPKSTVQGHEGKLVIGILEGIPVIVMQGRFHYYEGYGMDAVTFPIRVMKLLGVQDLIVTNAAGGCNKNFSPGDLMLITDHIKFFDESPLRGPNIESFGPRFNDLSKAYTPSLQGKLMEAAGELGMELKTGVYAFMPGPSFETPAEIRMLSMLGADAVGMSTVPEVIVASHAGIRVLGISCITNMAAGILDQPLNHEEVIETGLRVRDRFAALIRGVLSQW
jgi:purine-nucleoside phosphorylase